MQTTATSTPFSPSVSPTNAGQSLENIPVHPVFGLLGERTVSIIRSAREMLLTIVDASKTMLFALAFFVNEVARFTQSVSVAIERFLTQSPDQTYVSVSKGSGQQNLETVFKESIERIRRQQTAKAA